DMREHLWSTGLLYAKVAEGKETEGANFRDWFDFNEPLRTLPSHRILALLRGRQQGVLELRLGVDAELEAQTPHPCVARIAGRRECGDGLCAVEAAPRARWLGGVCRRAWRVRRRTASESELFGRLRDDGEAEAIRVFAANLKDLLLAAPAGPKAVLGLDPGIRTGCKVAVFDRTGKVVDTATVYRYESRSVCRGFIAQIARL